MNFFILLYKQDPKLCFEYIYNSIKDSPIEYCLLSILQHLILIRDEFQTRYSYFRLIEECVARIALHKDGRDPDFEYTSKFDFDVDSLLSNLLILCHKTKIYCKFNKISLLRRILKKKFYKFIKTI